MAAQDDIRSAISAIQAVTADLVAAVSAIQGQLAAGQPVDTSGLTAAVAALQAVDEQVKGLETPPAPPAGP